jgi:predicted nucleic acid-binding protein
MVRVERGEGFVDTNVVVRHVTGDLPAQAEAAGALLAAAEADALLLTDLVFAEIVYVLESFYELPRDQVAERLRAVLAFPATSAVDPPLLLRALDIYERHRLDLAEAYLVACAEASGLATVVSFDRTIDRVGTVARIEPEPDPPISLHMDGALVEQSGRNRWQPVAKRATANPARTSRIRCRGLPSFASESTW